MTEPCDLHEQVNDQMIENAKILGSIDARLRALLWVGGVLVGVYLLPAVYYVVSVEKRLTSAEAIVVRLINQRNLDHPQKEKFQ